MNLAPLTRTDWGAAAAVGAGVLALFVATACGTVYVGDSAEFTTAAAGWGVAHPPGYPLYTLLAGLFVRAIPVGDVAYRSNLFSAVCGAAAVAGLWLLLRRLGVGALAALAAVLGLAFGATFWSLCLAAEVHALDGLLLVLTLLAGFSVADASTAARGRRRFVLFGLAAGFLVGHRNLNVLCVAPLVVWLELARRRRGGDLSPSVWAVAALAAAATATVYLYLPWASRRAPLLDTGAPSTVERFVDVITARPYFRHLATGSARTNVVRLLSFVGGLPGQLGLAALAIPLGVAACRRRAGWGPAAALGAMAIGGAIFASLYNVIDVDAYFLPATMALAVFAAMGVDALAERWKWGSPLFAGLAVVLVPLHFHAVDLRPVRTAERYGRDLLRSAPPHAIVVSVGDTSRNVLLYGQAVLGERTDVALVGIEQLSPAYLDQLRRRHPRAGWPDRGQGADGGGGGMEWIGALVERNAAARPVCLTLPLPLELPEWIAVPSGLLSCFQPRDRPVELSSSLAFWRGAGPPTSEELDKPDPHLHMVALAYATSRFSLARALAEGGQLDEARVQLRALVAADPDQAEVVIAAAKARVGQTARPFAYGQRARIALARGGADDRAGFLGALTALPP